MSTSVALITGASGGIGLELAALFAEKKHDVILVARSRARLEEIARDLSAQHQIKAHVIEADLARHGGALELYNKVKSMGLKPGILVNNAGFGDGGFFPETDIRKTEEMLWLNIETLTMLTRYFLPDFIAVKNGRILNVASTAAFQAGPFMAVYYATKAYVLSFSEALSEELRGTGITVTALCPGPTITGFQSRAGLDSSWLFKLPLADARSVAKKGYSGLMRGCAIVIPGLMNRLGTLVVWLSPRFLVRRVIALLNKNR